MIAALGFDNGINPPSRCSKAFGNCTAGNSSTEPYIAAHNMLLSHAAATQRYREKYQVHSTSFYFLFFNFWFELKPSGFLIYAKFYEFLGKTEGEDWNSLGHRLV